MSAQLELSGIALGLLADTGLKASLALMGGALLVLPSIHVLLTVGAGVSVYAAAGWLSGAWHPRDFSRLRRV